MSDYSTDFNTFLGHVFFACDFFYFFFGGGGGGVFIQTYSTKFNTAIKYYI